MVKRRVVWLVFVTAIVLGTALLARSAAAASADLSVERVREVLLEAGYTVGQAIVWEDDVRMLEARNGDSSVRAFVYRDTHAAVRAHMAAGFAGSSASDDAGPQLLSGFGASAWRRNVALIESSPQVFGALMPAEPDCGDGAPSYGPDLSQPIYRVDPALVQRIEAAV